MFSIQCDSYWYIYFQSNQISDSDVILKSQSSRKVSRAFLDMSDLRIKSPEKKLKKGGFHSFLVSIQSLF